MRASLFIRKVQKAVIVRHMDRYGGPLGSPSPNQPFGCRVVVPHNAIKGGDGRWRGNEEVLVFTTQNPRNRPKTLSLSCKTHTPTHPYLYGVDQKGVALLWVVCVCRKVPFFERKWEKRWGRRGGRGEK